MTATLALMALSVPAAAQGFNADYLPFPHSKLRRFPLTRHAFPEGSPMNGKPFNVSGVAIRETEVEVSTATDGIEQDARRLHFSGREKGGDEWRLQTASWNYYDAVYEGDLDRNGVRDLVISIGTGGNGLAPPTHLIFLTFNRRGHATLFEATGYFDARRGDIFDLTDLDGDGRAELLFMVYDDGYWVTEVYRVLDGRWSRVRGRFAGLQFPLYTRFTRRPNHHPVSPAPGRRPRAPDLIEESDGRPALDAEEVEVRAACINFKTLYSVQVVNDEQTLAELFNKTRVRECSEHAPPVDFNTHTLIGVQVRAGSCEAGQRFRHRLIRDDAKKRYLVMLDWLGNPCRGLGFYELWLKTPKLTEGYHVEYEVRALPREEWTP